MGLNLIVVECYRVIHFYTALACLDILNKYSHLVATPMARLISRAYIYRYFTCLSLYWWFHSFLVYLREVRQLIKSSNLCQVSRRNSSESHQTFNTCFIESHEVIMVFV